MNATNTNPETLECNGHPAGPSDAMGETVYCDGSCRQPVKPVEPVATKFVPGEEVYVSSAMAMSRRQLKVVERLTATRVVLTDGSAFHLKTLREVGNHYGRLVEKATPELRAVEGLRESREALRGLLYKIDERNKKALSLEGAALARATELATELNKLLEG